MGIHKAAMRGFDRGAAAYERGRPSYPPDAVGWMVDRLGIGPGRTVVDLGAGTGKFTRLLRPTGARLLALEPVAAMRDQLRAAVPGIEVLDGLAQSIPLANASVDALVAAQAFHWFAEPASLSEMHRVLRPDGGLGLIWNRRDTSDPLQAAIEEILHPYRDRAPRHEGNHWREVMTASPLFGSRGERRFRHRQPVDRAALLDRVLSISFVAALDEAEQSRVRQQVEQAAGSRSEFVLPYWTEVFLYRRIP